MLSELWQEYCQTQLRFAGDPGERWCVTLAPNGEAGDRPLRPPRFATTTADAWIVTAHNPRSKELTARDNAALNAGMESDIADAGYRVTPAAGAWAPKRVPGSPPKRMVPRS